MAHVVLIGALPESLTNFRGHLIRAMVAAGHRVTAMALPAGADQIQAIESLGASFRPFPVQRNGLNPWRDAQTLLVLRNAFRELKPDVVLAYTVKPVVWGGLALTGIRDVRFIALITGLGFAFQGEGFIRRSLTRVVGFLYKSAMRNAQQVIFQNTDNCQEFLSRGLVAKGKCHVVGGSGVDIDHFPVSSLTTSEPSFLLIARLLAEKGIREYVQAARRVRQQYAGAVFRLVGPVDPSPDGISLKEVLAWHEEGIVEYMGPTTDVRPFIADSHVFVLPSYHEGMPRTVLEAMAMGRPIITTDVPGCRETVVPGENGYLVPKADAEALGERMVWFIEHRDQWQRMGQVSRRIAEEKFDVHKINAEMLRIMNLSEQGARF